MDKKKLRILAIGAHPDDCEFRMGGTAVKYSNLGHTVKFIAAAMGDAGHYELRGEILVIIRREEAKKACEIAGIESEVLNNRDNGLEADISTRENFICMIREFQPDLIFTHRLNDYHPDHRRTAMLVQDSSYMVRVPNVCPLIPALSYSPILLYMEDDFEKPVGFEPHIVVSIDDVLDTKVEMLHCHKSQIYEWLPWMDGELDLVPKGECERKEWLKNRILKRSGKTAKRFYDELIKQYGQQHGSHVKTAEAFEISEYGGKLYDDEIQTYFPFL